jgi:hypothetical protein
MSPDLYTFPQQPLRALGNRIEAGPHMHKRGGRPDRIKLILQENSML